MAPTRAIYSIEIVNGVYFSETIVTSGNSALFKPQYMAIDENQNVFFAKSNSNDGGIYMLTPAGTVDKIYTPSGSDLLDPRGIALNALGDLFVACNNNDLGGAYIAKFEMDNNNQVVSHDLNFLTSFDGFMDLSFDSLGNLYAASDEHLMKIEFNAAGMVTNVNTS